MRVRLFAFLISLLVAGGALAETVYLVQPDADNPIEARDTGEKTLPGGAPDQVVTENGLTVNFFFMDIRNNTNVGFDSPTVGAAARARLADALRYIADVINETGTLDVLVNASETDGSGALAFAGTLYSTSAGFQLGSTLQRLSTGTKPFTNFEEISVTVDFGFSWNFSSPTPTPSQADFQSVITHELTHGLGFASLSNSSGASQIASGVYATYDSLLRRRTGNKVLFSGSPPSFKGTVSDLVSNDLMFFGTQANALYAQGIFPPIFAPNPFQSGSSMSHWDTGNIVGGAVMEHAIVLGTVRREYSPVDIGALVDIGYSAAAEPGATPGNISSPASLNLGNATIGGGVSNATLTIANNGGATINGVASTVAPFSIVSGANYSIAPGGIANIGVRYTPLLVGASNANLTLTGDPDGNITVALSGNGVLPTPGNLVISPNPANFGAVNIGTLGNLNVTVQNTGGTSINGTASIGAPFTVTSNAAFTVGPGGSISVGVRFTPVSAGLATNTLTVTGDPDGNIGVSVSGTGVAAPANLITTPDLSPGIDMGSVPQGATSEFPFTVTNNGGTALSGNATATPPFSISVGATYNLAPGASANVKVIFTPTDTSDVSGTLTLTGDPDGAIAVDLIGTGLKASNAACSAVKGQSNTWSTGDALVVGLCGLGLLLATRRAAQVRI